MSGNESKSKMVGGLSGVGIFKGLTGFSDSKQRMDDDDELLYLEPKFQKKISGGLNQEFELIKEKKRQYKKFAEITNEDF